MNIAYITAGAGGMYCGSCLRDNALAAALMALGHRVHLIPTYTPTRTDEPNVSSNKIFLGGINLYLQQHYSLFRRTPSFINRFLDLRPILKFATRWGVRIDPAHLGDMTVSMLRGTAGFQGGEIRRMASFLRDEISPEVVNLPNSLMVGLAPEIKSRVGVPLCCTLQGEDIFLEGLPREHREESLRLIRESSEHVDAFIAVSRYHADYISGYLGIEKSRIRVVPLGINLNGHGRANGVSSDLFRVGFLARIAPEKGLHVLSEAYRFLRQKEDKRPSRLDAAGYLGEEHRGYLEKVMKDFSAWGLAGHFEYHGELDRDKKIAFLNSLGVLCVPAPYGEPKGIYVLEAMANGVPVVQPRTGAFPEIIEATGGGILVEPDRPEALAAGIHELWENPEKRRELGQKGSEGVKRHFSVENMAGRALEVYQELCALP